MQPELRATLRKAVLGNTDVFRWAMGDTTEWYPKQ